MGALDTLRSRGLPQSTYLLRAVPSSELAAAQREYVSAHAALREAEAAKRVTSAHKRALDKALDRVHGCFITLTIRALPPAELEDLIDAHKPDDDEREQGSIFHRKTFAPELIARCVFDSDDAEKPSGSAAEWDEQMTGGNMSLGEAASLFQACWDVNDRTPDPDVPKG